MIKRIVYIIFISIFIISLSGCDVLKTNSSGNGSLTASGTIAAREVEISAEVGGQVLEVNAKEGLPVREGDVLFRIDDALLKAQYDQALKGVETAKATVKAAQTLLETAKAQYQLAVQGARLADIPGHTASFQTSLPEEYVLPSWYFQKNETVDAARVEVDKAQKALDIELQNLKQTLQDASNADFLQAEKRLAQAQETYRTALLTQDQAIGTSTPTPSSSVTPTTTPTVSTTFTPTPTATPRGADILDKVAREQVNTAKAEMDAAQLEYDRLLTTQAATNILEARAHAAVAKARYDNAVDRLNLLLTGDDSLQLDVAAKAIKQAEAAVTQAEASQAQAESALNLYQLQIDKTIVRAPITGIIISRNMEVGEIVGPGRIVLVIANLDTVKLTVYVPESRYGKIKLGGSVNVVVDSYPGETFTGTITYISDKAEYTPRNVQTVEGRRSTVYAVELTMPNPDLKLKPGMPADVTFNP